MGDKKFKVQSSKFEVGPGRAVFDSDPDSDPDSDYFFFVKIGED